MTLPSNPPATTTPAALKTWAQNVADTSSDHEDRIDAIEADYVAGTLFDANTFLVADTDNTPVAKTVAASRILGRKATGGIDDMTTAEVAALFGTPDGTKFLADDGTLKTPAGGSSALVHKKVRKTAAVDNIATTSYVALESDGSFDLSVAAAAGDVLVVELAGTFGVEAVNKTIDAATYVSSSPLNYFGTSTTVSSHGPWFGVTGVVTGIAGSRRYTVQAGDIVTGAVTVRIMARGATSTTWTPLVSTDSPLDFYLTNIGPTA